MISHIAWKRSSALLLAASTVVQAGQAQRAWASAAAEALAAGDSAYVAGDLSAARSRYEATLQHSPAHFGTLWRLARVESELGEDAKGEEQRRLVSAAVEHARAAVKLAPDSAVGHSWLAVALGRQALKEGPKTRLALSREIKSEVDRALALDPGMGRAYHVRALWNRKLASLSAFERAVASTVLGGVPRGASMENAVADLRRAIEIEPDYVNHHLELGRTYMQLKRWKEARGELERAISLPPTSNPRDPHYQLEARELMTRLRKSD